MNTHCNYTCIPPYPVGWSTLQRSKRRETCKGVIWGNFWHSLNSSTEKKCTKQIYNYYKQKMNTSLSDLSQLKLTYLIEPKQTVSIVVQFLASYCTLCGLSIDSTDTFHDIPKQVHITQHLVESLKIWVTDSSTSRTTSNLTQYQFTMKQGEKKTPWISWQRAGFLAHAQTFWTVWFVSWAQQMPVPEWFQSA